MRYARAGAAALLAASAVLGSMATPDTPDRPLPTIDGWQILAADFHVHAFPGDGSLAAWDIADEARRQGLDVVTITNHNQNLAARLIAWVPQPSAVLLIPGDEVTAPAFHLAVVGTERAIDWRQSVPVIADEVHAQGGAVILAHPTREFPAAIDPEALRAVDGLDVAHPIAHSGRNARADLTGAFERASRIHPEAAPIGSSDFHTTVAMGICRTYVFVRDRSRPAVIDAIRHGRTVACDQNGRTFGMPVFRTAVESLCVEAAANRRHEPALARVARLAAWAALVGLICLGNGAARLPNVRAGA